MIFLRSFILVILVTFAVGCKPTLDDMTAPDTEGWVTESVPAESEGSAGPTSESGYEPHMLMGAPFGGVPDPNLIRPPEDEAPPFIRGEDRHYGSSNLRGDASNIFGDASEIYGNVSDLSGDVSNISGSVWNISGDVTNLSGDVTDLRDDVSSLQP